MQLRTSSVIYSFHETLKKKFNFSEYISLDKPTLFFGVYKKTYVQEIAKHRSKKIIWYGGTDSTYTQLLEDIKSYLNDGKTVVVAESKWIETDLDKAGIKYISISLCLDDLYVWKPKPLGDSLYWYKGNTSQYRKDYLAEVRKAFPNLNIIVNDGNTVSKEEMPKIYEQCFANVRPLTHDGVSMTVAEMALMGRMSIWNGGGPFSVPFKTCDDIIDNIRQLRLDYNYKLIAKRARSWFIEQEIKWTDLVLQLCGTDELDVANIFYESPGRAGSIFRIMRKEIVDKLPDKFGTEQWERNYIDKHLKLLNLKQLVTSKHSGFTVNEWKSVKGNKGYASGTDYLTYDKRFS